MKKITEFPFNTTLRNGNRGTSVVLIGATHDRYLGYTKASSPHATRQYAGVWDFDGKCLYTEAGSNAVFARSDRTIKLSDDGQDQYEKLTVDQRAILAALFHAEKNTNHLGMNYLQETLKVDVNLAAQVLTYANKKDFK